MRISLQEGKTFNLFSFLFFSFFFSLFKIFILYLYRFLFFGELIFLIILSVLSLSESRGSAFAALETLVPTQSYYLSQTVTYENNGSKNDCLLSILLLAHDSFNRRKHGEALEKYLDAFILDKTQPLTALCLANLLQFLANHPLWANRFDIFNDAMAFLMAYVHNRMPSLTEETCNDRGKGTGNPTQLSDLGKLQEIFYNIGRCTFSIFYIK
jgi:hypothetical protein